MVTVDMRKENNSWRVGRSAYLWGKKHPWAEGTKQCFSLGQQNQFSPTRRVTFGDTLRSSKALTEGKSGSYFKWNLQPKWVNACSHFSHKSVHDFGMLREETNLLQQVAQHHCGESSWIDARPPAPATGVRWLLNNQVAFDMSGRSRVEILNPWFLHSQLSNMWCWSNEYYEGEKWKGYFGCKSTERGKPSCFWESGPS